MLVCTYVRKKVSEDWMGWGVCAGEMVEGKWGSSTGRPLSEAGV